MDPTRVLQPIACEPVGVLQFLQHIIYQVKPCLVIVCSSRASFFRQVLEAIARESMQESTNEAEQEHDQQPQEAEEEGDDVRNMSDTVSVNLQHHLLSPTIQLLSNAHQCRLIFCHSVPELHAFLPTLPDSPDEEEEEEAGESSAQTVYLVNTIALHRHTTAFSAQGLSRAFAAAIEAAFYARQNLVIVECHDSRVQRQPRAAGDGFEEEMEQVASELATSGYVHEQNPWDERISILNVTTRRFGAGDRGWVGRTVPIRQLAGRWCQFESFPVTMTT